MRLTVNQAIFALEVFVRENPEWANEQIVFNGEKGGYFTVRRVSLDGKTPKWEEKVVPLGQDVVTWSKYA